VGRQRFVSESGFGVLFFVFCARFVSMFVILPVFGSCCLLVGYMFFLVYVDFW